MKRSEGAATDDVFTVKTFPVVAVNPDTNKAQHLYVAYPDVGENTGDKADVYLLCSTNRGTNWTTKQRVNTVWTNDQWMPAMAVKPDGTKLLLTWYDRRNDTNNGLIDLYGRWGAISSNGNVTLHTNDFRITTTNFPPVFAGVAHTNAMQYDPVYPPGYVDLHWQYTNWPAYDPEALDSPVTSPTYAGHVGEYNGAWSDGSSVYLSWTDYRLLGTRAYPTNQTYTTNQADIRLVRMTWP